MQSDTTEIGEIIYGKKVRVKAVVTQLRHHKIRNGNIMTDGVIGDNTGSVRCIWFTKSPITDLKIGSEYIFEGYIDNKYGRVALQKPSYVLSKENQQAYVPVPLSTMQARAPVQRRSRWDDIGAGLIFWTIVIGGFIAWFIFSSVQDDRKRSSGVTCQDVTSIDYNWDNDVLCTKPDGSTFYTDYSGGHKYDANFSR
jgi:RecG wedge domain